MSETLLKISKQVNKGDFDSICARVTTYATGHYTFKVNNGNTRARYEICSKLTIKTPERRQSGFKHIAYLVLAFLLLTLSR